MQPLAWQLVVFAFFGALSSASLSTINWPKERLTVPVTRPVEVYFASTNPGYTAMAGVEQLPDIRLAGLWIGRLLCDLRVARACACFCAEISSRPLRRYYSPWAIRIFIAIRILLFVSWITPSGLATLALLLGITAFAFWRSLGSRELIGAEHNAQQYFAFYSPNVIH